MYRCVSVCVCIYIWEISGIPPQWQATGGQFLGTEGPSDSTAPQQDPALGASPEHPQALALGMLQTHQFGTKGMLNILSPCPDGCASDICIVVARMETSGLFLFLLQCMFTGRYMNNPIHGAPLYSCSSHTLQNSLPSEHALPETLQAATCHGQCSWECVCPWLLPG